MPAELSVYLIAAFVGALVAGLAGFAFGLIASAIWLHVITPAQSAPLIAAFAIVIQGGTLWKLRHAIDIQRLMPFLVGAVCGIPLGAEVVRWATSAQMRSFIGVGLVLFSVYSLVRPKLPIVRGSRLADGIAGAISGFVGGSTGLAGSSPPPLIGGGGKECIVLRHEKSPAISLRLIFPLFLGRAGSSRHTRTRRK